jgi:hypothetical protein
VLEVEEIPEGEEVLEVDALGWPFRSFGVFAVSAVGSAFGLCCLCCAVGLGHRCLCCGFGFGFSSLVLTK